MGLKDPLQTRRHLLEVCCWHLLVFVQLLSSAVVIELSKSYTTDAQPGDEPYCDVPL